MAISSTEGIHVSAPAEPAEPIVSTPDQRQLIQAVKAIDPTRLFGENTELTFVIDRQTRRVLVRILDRKTGEIVNQIPPEYVVRLAEENKGR